MKRWIYLWLSVCTATPSAAQKWVPLSSSTAQEIPQTEVTVSNAQQFVCQVELPGLYDTEVTRDGQTYHALALHENQTLQNLGEPALPVVTFLLGVPCGKGYACEITDAVWDTLQVGQVYPYQQPLLETETEGDFLRSASVYAQAEYAPASFTFGDRMRWNGMDNVTLTVCPFRYAPRTGMVAVMKAFTVKVTFSGEVDAGGTARTPASDDPLLKSGLSNYNDALVQSYSTASKKLKSATEQYDYLIISKPDVSFTNSEAMETFCQWKRLKGYAVKLVTTQETGTSCAAIRNYILGEYPKGVRYVLFVGDHAHIPLYTKNHNGYLAKSDYWYGCMDGTADVQADIAIGRFCVNSLTELNYMVHKTLAYEKYPASGGWQRNTLLVAHKQNAPGKYQQCAEDIRTASYQHPFVFQTAYGASHMQGGNNATNQTVVNAINAGTGMVNYRGHGSVTGWDAGWSHEGVAFGSAQVEQLSPNGKYPVVFSVACQNGDISHSSTCLLEEFTRRPNGAVAFLGATENSYTIPNHSFNRFIFQAIGNEGVYHIGDVNNMAQAENISYTSNSSLAIINAFAYLWGGDPSLELWTGNLSSFNQVTVTPSGSTVTVHTGGIGGCTITATSADGSYFSSVDNVSTTTFTNVPSQCFFSVNKHNYVPYVQEVNYNTVYIQNQTFTTAQHVTGDLIIAGENVTAAKPKGKVVVKNGANVTFDATESTTLEAGFECEKGATLTVE